MRILLTIASIRKELDNAEYTDVEKKKLKHAIWKRLNEQEILGRNWGHSDHSISKIGEDT